MVPNLWERSTQSTQQKTLKCFNWRQSSNNFCRPKASVCSWLSDATSTGFVAAASVGPKAGSSEGTSRMSSSITIITWIKLNKTNLKKVIKTYQNHRLLLLVRLFARDFFGRGCSVADLAAVFHSHTEERLQQSRKTPFRVS